MSTCPHVLNLACALHFCCLAQSLASCAHSRHPPPPPLRPHGRLTTQTTETPHPHLLPPPQPSSCSTNTSHPAVRISSDLLPSASPPLAEPQPPARFHPDTPISCSICHTSCAAPLHSSCLLFSTNDRRLHSAPHPRLRRNDSHPPAPQKSWRWRWILPHPSPHEPTVPLLVVIFQSVFRNRISTLPCTPCKVCTHNPPPIRLPLPSPHLTSE